MGRKQEFICASCGYVTDSPRSTIECPRINGGPHSWSAIPMSASDAQPAPPINLTEIGYSNFFAFLGSMSLCVLAIVITFNTPDKMSGAIFWGIIIGWVIGGFIKPILKIAFAIGLFFGVCYVLDKFKIVDFSSKPEQKPAKVLRVNK